jgi:hypothetical protein
MFLNRLFAFIFFLPSIVCVAQASGNGSSTSANTDPNAPVMTFESNQHDFGTMDQDANGTWLFTFTNTGKEPLVIKDARGSCGCTVPHWPQRPIPPGDHDTIKVTYDTHRVGIFSKSVTINSNSKESPDMLSIKGKINAKPTAPPFTGNQNNGAAPYANNQDFNN